MIALPLGIVVLLAGAQDVPPQKKPATAAIQGRVTDAATGTALRQVRLTLTALPPNATPDGRRFTRTDNEGRYRFEGLPAARYTLTASKARYVTLQYGQRPAAATGKPIDLPAHGQQQIDVALPRAAAIMGRVTDEFSEPLERADVRVLKHGYRNGRRTLVSAGAGAITDDAGDYRISGVPPGEYVLVAAERSEGFGVTAEADIGFAPTFYPSTVAADQARVVGVRIGQDVTAVDISLIPFPTAVVSGVVLTAAGEPARGVTMMLSPIDGVAGGLGGQTTTQADGRFMYPRVLPGRYELHARKPASTATAMDHEAAIVPLTVATEAVDVSVPLSRGARVTGRAVPPDGVTAVPGRIVFTPAPAGESPQFGLTVQAGQMNDQWGFQFTGVIGARIIAASGLPPGWRIASVTRAGSEITDVPTVFKDGDDIVVTLADDAAVVQGRVTSAEGKPVDDATVVLYVDDASKWTWTPRSWSIHAARIDQDGTFKFETLPPGRYLIAAVADVLPGQEFDQEFLTQLRLVATAVTLQPRANQTVALKLVKP